MADLKWPWQGCPKTLTDEDGNVCTWSRTIIESFWIVYVRDRCVYKCPGAAGVEIETSHTHHRVLFVIDIDDD